MNQSNIVYALIKLKINGKDLLLLRYNKKWKDFSFVGGHVEKDEEDNWEKAIIKEIEEELPHSQFGYNFKVSPYTKKLFLPDRISKTTGKMTRYSVQWYHLNFIKNPLIFVEKLDFLPIFYLYDWKDLDDCNVGSIIKHFHIEIELYDNIPYSWPYNMEM